MGDRVSATGALILVVTLVITSPFLLYGFVQFSPYLDGFIVISGSMEPEIKTGALLFTYSTSAENIKTGDTITYRNGDRITTHKVIFTGMEDDELYFMTKGVANEQPDQGTVAPDQIIGKKLFSVPYLGFVAAWAGTPTGIFTLFILLSSILLYFEARQNIVTQKF